MNTIECKELVYLFAETYRDDILLDLVNNAEEILADKTIAIMMKTLVDLEVKDRDSRRRGIMLGLEPLRFLESSSYRSVLYNLLIRGKTFSGD